MHTVQRCFKALYLLFEKWKGSVTFHEVVQLPSIIAHLTGYSVSGYELHLYCQRKRYCRSYRRWSWFNRCYTFFRVYSVVSQDAPACLRDACKLDVCLPALYPPFIDEEVQKEVAVQAYLDLLIDRLSETV